MSIETMDSTVVEMSTECHTHGVHVLATGESRRPIDRDAYGYSMALARAMESYAETLRELLEFEGIVSGS